MPFSDLLVVFDSYPEATPPAAADQAVKLAAALGGQLTAMAVQVDIPLRSNRLADMLVHLSELQRDLEAQSAEACRAEVAQFETAARAAGVFAGAMHERVNLYLVPDFVTKAARTRDLCIVPIAQRYDGQSELAQTVVFGSGRPVIVFKSDAAALGAAKLTDVVVAWDGGRSAARALADAMPILLSAAKVRLLSVVNEKAAVSAGGADDVVRHLATHGVSAAVEEIDAAGRGIGTVFDEYLAAKPADLLVMGAYGHSRMREFILGGATQHILRAPPIPVFLAH